MTRKMMPNESPLVGGKIIPLTRANKKVLNDFARKIFENTQFAARWGTEIDVLDNGSSTDYKLLKNFEGFMPKSITPQMLNGALKMMEPFARKPEATIFCSSKEDFLLRMRSYSFSVRIDVDRMNLGVGKYGKAVQEMAELLRATGISAFRLTPRLVLESRMNYESILFEIKLFKPMNRENELYSLATGR